MFHGEIAAGPLPQRLSPVKSAPSAGGTPIMRPDPTEHALAALLQILENAERPVEEAPILTLRRWSEVQSPTRSHLKEAEPGSNRLVERIASAMLKVGFGNGVVRT